MLRFLILVVTVAVVLAWDPHLKIAEKIAIPHHIRHTYDYPYINIAQMINRNVRQGLQSVPLEGSRPQNLGLRQSPGPAPLNPNRGFQSQPFEQNRGFQSQPFEQNRGFQSQPFEQNRGFQSQPFEQNRGFRSSPVQTRFFERLSPNTRPDFGASRSNTFFNRRLS